MKHRIQLTVVLGFSLVFGTAHADQSVSWGDYTVHYNAFSTDTLTPRVAQAYGIKRSRNRALVNIVVTKGESQGDAVPMAAEVTGAGVNLTGQLKTLSFRQINEDGAIYYIADVSVDNGETLDFKIEATPDGLSKPFLVKFRKQFFTQ